MRIAIMLGAALLCTPAIAGAASFDCTRAKAPDERAVCGNRTLNDQDVRLSLLYEINRRTLAMGGRGALIDAQRAWLAARRQCGGSVACLTPLYDRRVAQLGSGLDRIYRNGPF